MNEQEGTRVRVDLVVVIDTSPSMKDEAKNLSTAAEAAIAAARNHCPADLRVVWLGIEGTWKETRFDRTVRQYLTQECQVPESALRARKRGEIKGGGAQEDGARVIEDLALHFDWRPEALRAVFFLGDEALEGGGSSVTQKDIAAADRAIQTAKEAGVAVHTYFGTTRSRQKDALQREYARVSHETGGQSFTDQDADGGFAPMLEKIICASRSHAPLRPAAARATAPKPATPPPVGCPACIALLPVAIPLPEGGRQVELRVTARTDAGQAESGAPLTYASVIALEPVAAPAWQPLPVSGLAMPRTGVAGTAYVVEYDQFRPDQDCFLYRLEVATGNAVLVGAIGRTCVADLVFCGQGLYGCRWIKDVNASELLRIDPATGRGTVIGRIGYGLYGLAYHAGRHTLYGTGSNRQLIAVDLATGAGRLIAGAYPRPLSEIAIRPDGRAYVTYIDAGDRKILATLDLDSGAIAGIGALSCADLDVWAMDFCGDDLYAVTRNGQLLRIDTATGAGSLMAETWPQRPWSGMSAVQAAAVAAPLFGQEVVCLPCLLLQPAAAEGEG